MIAIFKGLALGAAVLLVTACDASMLGPGGEGAEAVAEPEQEAAAEPAEVAQPLALAPAIDGRRDWFGARSAAMMDILVTARDERSWRVLWQLVGQDPPGALPEGAMGLGVFLAGRPSGGYTVNFREVALIGGDVVAQIHETTPPDGAIVTQGITAPYAVRLVQYHDAPVRFSRL